MIFSGPTRARLYALFMFMLRFVDIPTIIMTLLPYRDRRYLGNYFRTIREIAEGDRVKIYQQRAMQLLLIVTGLAFLIILSLPNKSEWTMLVLGDFVTLVRFPLSISYQLFGLLLMSIHFIEQMYFKVHHAYACSIMVDIYSERDKRFVLDSTKPVFTWTVRILQLYQCFTLLLDFIGVFVYFKFLLMLMQYHPFDQSFYGIFCFLWFHLSYGVTMFVLTCYVQIGVMAAVIAFAVNIILFTRLEETYKRYVRPAVDCRTSARLALYFRCNAYTMKYLFSMNRLYGPLLLMFLVANVPFNCSTLSAILMGQFDQTITFFASVLVAGQLTAIFAFHVMTARVSKRLHSPMNQIIGRYVRAGKCPLRVQLRNALNIQTMKTKKKYGVTYGPYGLVSMSSFFKFVFFYSELVLDGFK